jgi:hypothetical protein
MLPNCWYVSFPNQNFGREPTKPSWRSSGGMRHFSILNGAEDQGEATAWLAANLANVIVVTKGLFSW